jgi:hypothetical protein
MAGPVDPQSELGFASNMAGKNQDFKKEMAQLTQKIKQGDDVIQLEQKIAEGQV